MAFRYEFLEAAARDLYRLTRHNPTLLHAIATEHIPRILQDPFSAGEAKMGDLAGVRAYDLKVKGVAYRLIYQVNDVVVLFVALGPHAEAYRRARRR